MQLLEVFPDGERGEIQAMTMTQLLAFVYAAIPEADVHRNAALAALAMAEKEGKTSSSELKDGDSKNKEGPGDYGSRSVVRQHRFVVCVFPSCFLFSIAIHLLTIHLVSHCC